MMNTDKIEQTFEREINEPEQHMKAFTIRDLSWKSLFINHPAFQNNTCNQERAL